MMAFVDVQCPYCSQTFATEAQWQRHNLFTHMVHETGVGPLPQEQTETPPEPPVSPATESEGPASTAL